MTLKQLLILILFIFLVYGNVEKQSCDDYLLSKNRKISRSDINDLISVENQAHLKNCLTILGKDQLEPGIAELLWKALVKVRR